MKKLRISYNSPVILTFVFICLIVLAIGALTDSKSTAFLFMTYRASLTDPFTYLRFFSHVLGHADWGHFIGNASYLLLLGPMLEEKYGSKMIIEIILITALVTGLINFIFFPGTGLCGASGVIFAFVMLSSFTGFKEGEIPLTFILVAIIYLGQQLYEGLIIRDDIANTAHILGGLVGAVIGYSSRYFTH
ncbi:MAG: rhomboid family intramembrane serine protease [Lachnospiraceae bacterium]|nr:rhomboid family intramembrane serine protease [Lachnospiraceae bacterium]